MDHRGWYDRKSKEKPFCRVEDMYFISAMGPPGGGRSTITPRLQRHFNVITYTDLSLEMIDNIFSTIVGAFYRSFSPDVKDNVQPLIAMSLRVYDAVLTGPLKPTPNRSHYLFNLRDISRISQGLCLADKRSVFETVHVIRLWLHENLRVFGDRLINNIDRDWFTNFCLDEATKTFNLEKDGIFNSERILYGDYMDGIDAEPRIYRQINDLKIFVQKIEEFLEEYNSSVKI